MPLGLEGSCGEQVFGIFIREKDVLRELRNSRSPETPYPRKFFIKVLLWLCLVVPGMIYYSLAAYGAQGGL